MNFVGQVQKKRNYRCVDKTFSCEQLRDNYKLMRLVIWNYRKSNYWYCCEIYMLAISEVFINWKCQDILIPRFHKNKLL